MILSCEEMRSLEEMAFASGESAETLMDQAGKQIAQAVRQFFPSPGRCMVFFGKGHNGGDALVAARHLAAGGWIIKLQAAFPSETWADLTAKKHREFVSSQDQRGSDGEHGCVARPLVVLDGLLGIGAGGALRDPILSAAREINRLRATRNAQVFAIDLPTGLNADTGVTDPDCVVADFTLTVGYAKPGLLVDRATNFVGRLAVLTLPQFAAQEFSALDPSDVATPSNLAPLLPRRKFDSNKADYGRVAIVAGSRGFTGAAIMTAEAALRAGAGLITLFVTEDIYPIVAAAAPAEIMVQAVSSCREVLHVRRDVLAIGPGLGIRPRDDVLHLIQACPEPMVIDADALNILTTKIQTLQTCAGPRLLTPHPGEMRRLFATKDRTRREIVEAFTRKNPVTLLLKGSRTIVCEKGRPPSFNTTGSPGMATGGMGDVLTGVCAALIAQGRSPFDAARLGAWLCGRAAELAIYNRNRSEESLAATDVMENFGSAFKQLREGCC